MGAIDQSMFHVMLATEFPEIAAGIREGNDVLLHLEVAAFRRATENAMDAGEFWTTERHFRFVEKVLREVTADVENALRVSYIEDRALGECTPQRFRAVKERMPAKLRAEIARTHPNWR